MVSKLLLAVIYTLCALVITLGPILSLMYMAGFGVTESLLVVILFLNIFGMLKRKDA